MAYDVFYPNSITLLSPHELSIPFHKHNILMKNLTQLLLKATTGVKLPLKILFYCLTYHVATAVVYQL